jgi:PAS domain S-box-containing protein
VIEQNPIQPRALSLLQEDAVIVGDIGGRIDDVNPAACALTGYRRTELLQLDARELVAPEWQEFAVRQGRRKVESVEDVTSYECVFLGKDGTRIPVQVTSELVKNEGVVTAVRATVRDLRRQVAAERRLEESEERFRGAFEGAAIGMAMVAPDGRWLRVNDALTRLLGYEQDELLDLTFQDVTHPDDLERDLETVRDLLAGRISWYHMEKRYVRKDGSIVWGLLARSLVRDASGTPAYFISQISDITAAKAAEEARRVALANVSMEPRALSGRERDVVRRVAAGNSTAETAEALGIAEETVQTLVKRAMRKLGARNRTHLVATALRLGLLG